MLSSPNNNCKSLRPLSILLEPVETKKNFAPFASLREPKEAKNISVFFVPLCEPAETKKFFAPFASLREPKESLTNLAVNSSLDFHAHTTGIV